MTVKEVIRRALTGKRPPNEASTCDWIIRPLLIAAGYENTEIFSQVGDAGGKYPDYTVLPDEPSSTFYVEAKSWDVALDDNHAIQALNYANHNGRQWVVLTNGRTWRLYDNQRQKPVAGKLVVSIDIEDDAAAARFFDGIGKNSRFPQSIVSYVEKEEKLRSEVTRISLLAKILPQDLANPSSDIVSAICAVYSKRPELTAVTNAEIAAVLSHQHVKDEKPEPDDLSRPFTKYVKEVLDERGGFAILHFNQRWIWFLPEYIVNNLPENADEDRWERLSKRVSVCFWMRMDRGDRFEFVFECCRTKNPEDRLRFVKGLRCAGFELTESANDPEASYSRFWIEGYRKRGEVDVSERGALKDLIRSMLDERADGIKKLGDICRKMFAK